MMISFIRNRSLGFLMISLAFGSATEESSIQLTYDNYDEITNGKTVFIKFFSPSCGHCQEIAPVWERMAKQWVNHDQGLVGSIDCTEETKFCDDMKLSGLPTLLYGEPNYKGALLKEYTNDKTYEDLSEFANATLFQTACSPINLEACEDLERKHFETFLSLELGELSSIIDEKENIVVKAKREFQTAFDDMQSSYDRLGTENEIKKAKIKSKIKVLKAIIDSRSKNA
mmetsp:Transcript_1890/g.2901  ORF Transcript_1890/g.2901 Transcript_1890/m.2901 type:complete len:228 (+) Transcript_1890:48-731(+)